MVMNDRIILLSIIILECVLFNNFNVAYRVIVFILSLGLICMSVEIERLYKKKLDMYSRLKNIRAKL